MVFKIFCFINKIESFSKHSLIFKKKNSRQKIYNFKDDFGFSYYSLYEKSGFFLNIEAFLDFLNFPAKKFKFQNFKDHYGKK
jgi:hypothetical protein